MASILAIVVWSAAVFFAGYVFAGRALLTSDRFVAREALELSQGSAEGGTVGMLPAGTVLYEYTHTDQAVFVVFVGTMRLDALEPIEPTRESWWGTLRPVTAF